jgi:hypothetical protein
MSSRLKGTIQPDCWADRLYVHQLSGMHQATERYLGGIQWKSSAKRKAWREMFPQTKAKMMSGDAAVVEKATAAAELLIDEAIIADPRLSRRSAWFKCEPDAGIDADPAMVASGEERCCLERRRLRMADRSSVEPCRVVISTDSKDVTPSHCAAFIAAAKLAQQFRPLELWWQGAWLIEQDGNNGKRKGHGFVFLVPLVSGDLDFSRLQFVLSSDLRDHVSFNIMRSYAENATTRMGWGGGVGEYSYLENTHDFVSEKGIKATPEYVASHAAKWAGLPNIWEEYISPWQAEQTWRPESENKYTPPTEAERKANEERWAQQDRERQAKELLAAKERLTHV